MTEKHPLPEIEINLSLVDTSLLENMTERECRVYTMVPFHTIGGLIMVAVAEPLDFSGINYLSSKFKKCRVNQVLADRNEIIKIIDAYFRKDSIKEISKEIHHDDIKISQYSYEQEITPAQVGEPVVKLMNQILIGAIKQGASDIHIECDRLCVRIRYRVDGVLFKVEEVPRDLHSGMISRLKIISKMNISERRLPQDGGFFLHYEGNEIDLRVATFPTIYGENATIRILDQSKSDIELDKIGLQDKECDTLKRNIEKPQGFILVAGPTGSGKTTTLYAILNFINSISRKIVTIEDPAEYRLKIINQVPIDRKIKFTFASALKAILRNDPDVVLVGEIRDMETAEIAIQASITGHLMLSTLHVSDTSKAFSRLINLGISYHFVQESVSCVVAQRLLRRLCPECKTEYLKLSAYELTRLGMEQPDTPIYQSVGCPLCRETGYIGRIGVFEIMEVDRDIKEMITATHNPDHIRDCFKKKGANTMWAHARNLVLSGETSLDEIIRIVPGD